MTTVVTRNPYRKAHPKTVPYVTIRACPHGRLGFYHFVTVSRRRFETVTKCSARRCFPTYEQALIGALHKSDKSFGTKPLIIGEGW